MSMTKQTIRAYALPLCLLLGAGIAGIGIAGDFIRFYHAEGTVFKIKDCVFPNPVTRPCFYGFFAFVSAAIWSFALTRMKDEQRCRKQQKYLQWFLVACVLFAWSNFFLEVFRFYDAKRNAVEAVGCSGLPIHNPLFTTCFAGSVLFLLSGMLLSLSVKKEPSRTDLPS